MLVGTGSVSTFGTGVVAGETVGDRAGSVSVECVGCKA